MKGIFDLKVDLLFHHMFTLFLCLYYIFDLYKKPNFNFPNYGSFVSFKDNSS